MRISDWSSDVCSSDLLFDLLKLLNTAPSLPQADQLARLAQKRGATILPSLPQVQKLAWFPGAPRRELTETIRQDAAGQALGEHILPLIQNDHPAAAEALLGPAEAELSPNAPRRTEEGRVR